MKKAKRLTAFLLALAMSAGTFGAISASAGSERNNVFKEDVSSETVDDVNWELSKVGGGSG